ncbi:MAG: carbohydrate ABC transporter permease, partial [Anaerolineae bacterium]|nr:carbohydrate ABC transporter permease [Anaerolineae bacterium]
MSNKLRALPLTAGKYLTLLLGAFIALIPLVVVFLASLKTADEYKTTNVFAAPQNWGNFDNYVTAFTRGNMLQGFINTSIILVISVTATIIIGSMAAYVLDRFEFRFKKLIVFLFLLATLVPGVTTQVATFQVVNFMGLFNTRWAAILLFMGTDIISIYIFIQFLKGISKELDEAALIDGASYFMIYWRIILPLLKPAIATVIIIKGVAIYNEFYIPFLYMPKKALGVVSTALFKFKGPYGTQWEIISAGIVIA